MKRTLVILVLIGLMVLTTAGIGFAHPKGPTTMPEESIKGTHTAVFNVPGFPQHILIGLMIRTGIPCHE